jgi:hypothetical protein
LDPTTGLVQASLVGPGLVLWGPKAAQRREDCTQELRQYLMGRKFQPTYNHYIVHWPTWEKYKELLGLPKIWTRSRESTLETDAVMERGDDYAFGASKVIHHALMVQSMFKSYQDLPIGLFEFGEIYEQGPPVSNHFGLTLSIFDVGSMESALLIELTKVVEIAGRHGFNGDGVVRSTTLTDDHYVSAEDKREPVVVTFVDCKMENSNAIARGTEEEGG